LKGSSTPSNSLRSFTSEVSVTVNVSGIHGVGTVADLPLPANPDTGLYQVLIVNRGPWAVRLIGLTGPEGTFPLAQGDTLVAANTSRLFDQPLIVTATTLTLEAQQAGNSVVDIHRGLVGTPALAPIFTLNG
jgi:hypothetical protein